jgi:hypothetical protein
LRPFPANCHDPLCRASFSKGNSRGHRLSLGKCQDPYSRTWDPSSGPVPGRCQDSSRDLSWAIAMTHPTDPSRCRPPHLPLQAPQRSNATKPDRSLCLSLSLSLSLSLPPSPLLTSLPTAPSWKARTNIASKAMLQPPGTAPRHRPRFAYEPTPKPLSATPPEQTAAFLLS